MERIVKFKASTSNLKNAMILIIIIIINIFSLSNTYCQDKAYFLWGNNLNDTDKLGSINYAPLNFFTNNLKRGYFSENGDFNLMTNAYFSKNLYLDSTVQASYLSILHNAEIKGILKVGNTISLNGSIIPGQGELSRDEITGSKEALVFGFTNEDVNKFSDIKFGFGTRQPLVNFHIKGRSYVAPPHFNHNVSIKSTGNPNISGTTLRIEDEVYGGAIPIGLPRGTWWDITASDNSSKLFIGTKAYDPSNNPYTNNLIAITTKGNVGIGTMDPKKTLHINGSILLSGLGDNRSILFTNVEATETGEWAIEYISAQDGNDAGLNIWKPFGSTGEWGNYKFFINNDGNVGIGTGKPEHRLDVDGSGHFTGNVGIGTTDPQYKLDVCGTIRSKEWIVEEFSCMPDFVFLPEYELMPLDKRKQMIFENSHMPYMLSESEMKESGVPVFKTMQGIIQNTEDIYLYLFEMDERLKKLEKENENLKEKNEQLKQKINSISILASGQTGKFSCGLLFSPEINFYEAENNEKKTSINYRFGLIGEFKINDYIYIQSGMNYIIQTYDIFRSYNHCAFNPDDVCPAVMTYINKNDYSIISIPIQLKIKKTFDNSKFSPFVSLNVNNNFHLLSKYYSAYSSDVDELKEVKYFGNTGNIGFGIEYLLWSKIKMNLSTHIRIIEYRKKDPIVYEKEDQINTFNNVGLSISILYVL